IQGDASSGGNRLVIAAIEKDWIAIKKFLDKIDKPEKQVIIEVYIVDFRLEAFKTLAGTNRTNQNMLSSCDGFAWLSSQVTDPSVVLPDNPTTLAADLLSKSGSNGVPNTVYSTD